MAPFSFGGSGLFPSARQAETGLVWKNGLTVQKATLTTTEVKGALGDLFTYELGIVAFDATENETATVWESVTNGLEHTFVATGSGIKVRVTAIGTGGASTYLSRMEMEITLEA